MRKICVTHLFSSKRVQTFSWILEEEVNRMIRVISSLSSKSKIANLSELAMILTKSIICRIGFCKNYSDDEQSTRRFQSLLHETEAMLAGFFFSDYFPFMWWVDKINGASSKLETNIFVAGTNTFVATIVWAMTELMLNPNAMRKVQEEVRNLIKEQQSSTTFIQEQQLQHLMYLKAVIKKHLDYTLQVQFWHLGKQCKNAPSQAITKLNPILDPENWENPESFHPERFLGSSIDYKGQHFELLPFGAGRRGYPGLMLGATIVELALANLLCFFDWELPTPMKREDIDVEVLPGLAAYKKTALCLVARNFTCLQQM
ncbi:Cytochrome P450 83B1 [Bienertia sinuspersici]